MVMTYLAKSSPPSEVSLLDLCDGAFMIRNVKNKGTFTSYFELTAIIVENLWTATFESFIRSTAIRVCIRKKEMVMNLEYDALYNFLYDIVFCKSLLACDYWSLFHLVYFVSSESWNITFLVQNLTRSKLTSKWLTEN